MTLPVHVVENLKARMELLESDFETWLSRTDVNGQLKQHHTQVRRATGVINGMITVAFDGTAIVDASVAPDLNDLPELRDKVRSIHVIWDFFRDKFSQRDVENIAVHLGAADDLAWELYKPFLNAASEVDGFDKKVKEPPLLFYTPEPAPYAQARTKQFQPLGINEFDFKRFEDILSRIPVPVIAVPWASANRLPDLVVVGHETGHIVAEDLGLKDDLVALIQRLDLPEDAEGKRKKCWLSWSDEVFADIFGTLATGMAFIDGLAGELAGPSGEIRFAEVNFSEPGSYPTPTLRIVLCEAVLELVSVPSNSHWQAAFGNLVNDSRKFGNDIKLIVAKILANQWVSLNSKTLTELLPWDNSMQQQVETNAQRALMPADLTGEFTVRQTVATSMHAWQSKPKRYLDKNIDRNLAAQIVVKRANEVRSILTQAIRTGSSTMELTPDFGADDEQLGTQLATSFFAKPDND